MTRQRISALVCMLVATIITACGGGGSDYTPTNPNPPSGATAPAITTQPGNISTTVGNTAVFTVAASGTAPLTYQWQKNGTAISGATSATYTTPTVQLADDGAMFSVVVTNSAGSVTSNNAKLTVATMSGPSTSAADVVTFKNDTGRTGQYLAETVLTTANVNSSSFGLLRQLSVDGKVDAQPLYLAQLTVGTATRNVLFVATENGTVYAFDADSGDQIWKVSLLKTGEMPSDTHGCGQVTPMIGITSTPVIDRTAGTHGTLYVVAMSIDQSSNYHQRLHALDVTTGAELLNGPMEITATFSNQGATTTFEPGQYEERAALLLANGTIYTSWTSHCDIPPYGGWVIAFDQATLARTAAVNVAPNSNPNTPVPGVPSGDDKGFSRNGPAIWMSGDGPGADAAGNVYFLTGNGRFEVTMDSNGFPNLGDYGNSFVRLTKSGSNLTVSDYFAMSDGVHLSAQDTDLGSGGEMLLPDLRDGTNTVKHLIVGAGKSDRIYVVDRDNMGKFSPTANNIWQQLDNALGGGVHSSPAYFNNTVYYGAIGAELRAFSITNAKLSASATSRSSASFGYPGTSPAISANGTSNAIVWAHSNGTTAVLYAYDATNLATELYDSNQATGGRDHFGTGNKFITPMIAGGKVYVGTTNSVAVFGLLH
jgi:hypothetical protein